MLGAVGPRLNIKVDVLFVVCEICRIGESFRAVRDQDVTWPIILRCIGV